MLLKTRIIHSLLIIPLLLSASLAFAQANVMRGQSNEPLPTLIVPQDNSSFSPPYKINRVQTNSVQWSYSGQPDDYKVYPDLSFDYIRKYNFRIIPSFKKDNQIQAIPDGYYYLQVALLKPDLEEKIETFDEITDQYITGAKRVVYASGGIISTPLSFHFPSLAPTTYKNRLLMEILPLQQDQIKTKKHLGRDIVDTKESQFIVNTKKASIVLSIPFAPMQNADSVSTVEKTVASDITYDERLEISAIMAEGVRKLHNRINETKFLKPALWADKNNVAILYDDKIYNRYESLKERTEICQEIDKNLNYQFEKFKRSTVEYRARRTLSHFCNNEKNSLIFQKVQFIHPQSAMTVLHKERHGVTTQLALSLTKGNNHSKSFDQFETTTLSLSPLELLSLKNMKIPGLSINRNYTINEALSHSAFEGGILSQNLILEVRKLSLKVRASNTRSCYFLKLNQQHSHLTQKQNKMTKEYLEDSFGKNINWGGQLVCKTQRQAAEIQEDYFHILPALAGAGISDGMDPRNQVINLSLRGFQDFNLFTHQIRQSLTNKYRAKVMPNDVLTSFVTAETVPGTHFTNYDLNSSRPNFAERNFFDQKNLEFD